MARFDNLADWLEWQEAFHPQKIDLGLDRAAGVFKTLNPENIKPLTIIVAGTNGKGSCIAFLEAIYRAQGYRVGCYTSPHIIDYNERIRIDGIAVDDATLCATFERIDQARSGVSLSYFEFGTLTALDIFWQSGLDIQLLEVGLGGRLDAVNIIDADVCIITSICIDHVDWLGETREAIAAEKAGIFRTGVPAVIGDIDPPDSLFSSASQVQAPLSCLKKEFDFRSHDSVWQWVGEIENRRLILDDLPMPALKGQHQFRNAATVLMAVSLLNSRLFVSEQAMHTGLQSALLKGRFQLLEAPIPILMDVAHNVQAVQALKNYLQENYPNQSIYAIFSMMKDKDIEGVIQIIDPIIQHWFITTIDNSRGASQSKMQNAFKNAGIDAYSAGLSSFSVAFEAARNRADSESLILVFGSFFLVSDCMAEYQMRVEMN